MGTKGFWSMVLVAAAVSLAGCSDDATVTTSAALLEPNEENCKTENLARLKQENKAAWEQLAKACPRMGTYTPSSGRSWSIRDAE